MVVVVTKASDSVCMGEFVMLYYTMSSFGEWVSHRSRVEGLIQLHDTARISFACPRSFGFARQRIQSKTHTVEHRNTLTHMICLMLNLK